MSRLKSIFSNLKLIFSREIAGLLGEAETRAGERSDKYEAAVDSRLDERLSAFESNSDQRFESIERKLDDRLSAIERNLDARFDKFSEGVSAKFDDLAARLSERLDAFEGQVNDRLGEFDTRIETRLGEFDTRIDARFEGYDRQITDRFTTIENRIDERASSYESALDNRIDERLGAVETRLDQRFEDRARSVDARIDDRLARLEKQVDERLGTHEERTDDRMERHERKVDSMIRQMSHDIVERNDIMLQIFDQRMDKQRRGQRAGRESHPQAGGASDGHEEAGADEPEEAADTPSAQMLSFRKLANASSAARIGARRFNGGEEALYHQILAWKKIAHEGINVFTPDEQETVDYILSFIDDPKELDYVSQHLRRFVATLHRIPPARRSTDRLLELGSLAHLAPAIRKYGGYNEIHRADYWDSDEKSVIETVRQKGGPDSFSFELRNFNVEREKFPYPDGHFSVVLCCELIEHLMSDPMHMLWECNRVLEPDGYLLLTTPNIAGCRAIEGLLVGCAPYLLAQYNVNEVVDQHNREYAPYEVGVALAAAGFKVVELETEDVWLRSNPAIIDLLERIEISTELRGDNIFALARKAGAPVERYPKELYID